MINFLKKLFGHNDSVNQIQKTINESVKKENNKVKKTSTQTEPTKKKVSEPKYISFGKDIYPTRNFARAVIKHFFDSSSPDNYSTALLILWFQKKYNSEFITFVFTNALIDVNPSANVNNENSVDLTVISKKSKSLTEIEKYFQDELNINIVSAINEMKNYDKNNRVKLTPNYSKKLDLQWFNNSDRFIHPLINAYQNFKQKKGMLFQRVDIKQIIIDYSVVLSNNHFQQNGVLSKKTISEITNRLTKAANDCISSPPFNPKDIEYEVIKDLTYNSTIKEAYDFIKQF